MTEIKTPFTGDPEADLLLTTDPLALLIGMLLDQQVPMEWAFISPHRLQQRMGGQLDAAKIAATSPEDLETIFREKPMLHRFPAAMAKRTQALCQVLVDEFDGDAGNVWHGAADGKDLGRRLKSLPGFGVEKAKIFTAVLAKRLGVQPDGWQEQAGPFADATPRSVADIDGPEAYAKVREYKKAKKAEGKTKAD